MRRFKWLIVGLATLILATAIVFGISAKTESGYTKEKTCSCN